jgi:hypothetical protein
MNEPNWGAALEALERDAIALDVLAALLGTAKDRRAIMLELRRRAAYQHEYQRAAQGG